MQTLADALAEVPETSEEAKNRQQLDRLREIRTVFIPLVDNVIKDKDHDASEFIETWRPYLARWSRESEGSLMGKQLKTGFEFLASPRISGIPSLVISRLWSMTLALADDVNWVAYSDTRPYGNHLHRLQFETERLLIDLRDSIQLTRRDRPFRKRGVIGAEFTKGLTNLVGRFELVVTNIRRKKDLAAQH